MNATNPMWRWPHAAGQIAPATSFVATSHNHGRILNPSPIKGRPTTIFLRTPSLSSDPHDLTCPAVLSLLGPNLLRRALLYSTHSPNCQPHPPSLSSSVYRPQPSSSAIPQAHQLLPEADAVGAIECPPCSAALPCHALRRRPPLPLC
jgi:hypothetical protein